MLPAYRPLQSHGRRPNDSLERRPNALLVDWLPTNHLNEQQEFQQKCLPAWPEQRRPVLNMLTSRTELQLPVLPRDKPKWPKKALLIRVIFIIANIRIDLIVCLRYMPVRVYAARM